MKLKVKQKLYEAQRGKCYYCKRKMFLPPWSDRNHPWDFMQFLMQVSIEHKQPRSKGGLNTPDNVVLTCLGCNWSKNNMTELQFKNKLASGFQVPQPWVRKRVIEEVLKSQKRYYGSKEM